MEHVQESGNSIASSLTDFSLLNQCLIKQSCGILLLLVTTSALLALGFLSRRRTRNVEPHLDKLIITRGRLLPLSTSSPVRISVSRQREFNRHLIAAGQVGVGYFRVRNLKGGAVLHVEGELSFCELGFAPIPSPQRVLLVLEVGAVPVLEDLGEAVVVVVLEAVQLDDARGAVEDLQLVAPRRAAPLGASDLAAVKGEGVAATGGLPAEAVLCESAFAALFGEVEVDVVEALAGSKTNLWLAWNLLKRWKHF